MHCPFSNEPNYACCQNWKVECEPLSYPLQHVHFLNTQYGKKFRNNIRKNNNLVAFATTTMNLANDLHVRNVCGFVIPIVGHISYQGKTAIYNQFYIYDGEEAIKTRTDSLIYDVNLSKTTTEIEIRNCN